MERMGDAWDGLIDDVRDVPMDGRKDVNMDDRKELLNLLKDVLH